MVQIILSEDESCGVGQVQEWLEFNGIDFKSMIFWNKDSSQFQLPSDIDNSIVVMNHKVFFWDFLDTPSTVNQLVKFLKRNNKIWLIGMDSAITTAFFIPNKRKNLLLLDNLVDADKLFCFFDADLSAHCWTNHLKNIKIVVMKYNFFFGRPRVQSRTPSKNQPRHDYLLTMVQKKSRPHRKILWKELQNRPELLDHGLIISRSEKEKRSWVGQKPSQHTWYDGHPSMDLYLDCCLEIVPETCYRDLYFFTEKTHKPIATKTPFLVVSTCGYLDYLRRLGFQTFDSLIDESYDQHHRVEDRVKSMVDTLEDIVRTGAYDFYQASQSILDHNFSRLCEIAGGWQYHFDQIMWSALDRAQTRITT